MMRLIERPINKIKSLTKKGNPFKSLGKNLKFSLIIIEDNTCEYMLMWNLNGYVHLGGLLNSINLTFIFRKNWAWFCSRIHMFMSMVTEWGCYS